MATLVGIRFIRSGILARNVLSSRILPSVGRAASGLSEERLEKIKQRIEGEIENFTSTRHRIKFLAEDYSPDIVFEDGYAGDKVLGIFNYQLRILKYNTFVHLRSAGTGREIESSEMDVINRAITVAWSLKLSPGWSFVFFFGLFGWAPILLKKIIRPKSNLRAGLVSSDGVQHFFTSKFILDERGRITRHILTLQKTIAVTK
ncbi:uncharacterized protein LOC141849361 [Brevipalpus obovatus]|uniref:uncharacterized protein LOC141849361 n=1 Tax=Brevipalpus obovatus TaxID=246614 RepID=UPI003D9E6490